jgi:hypothetical protein
VQEIPGNRARREQVRQIECLDLGVETAECSILGIGHLQCSELGLLDCLTRGAHCAKKWLQLDFSIAGEFYICLERLECLRSGQRPLGIGDRVFDDGFSLRMAKPARQKHRPGQRYR